jgi:hypothetical protein
MEAQAVYLYPYRLETERLVMFYDDGVTDPEGDIRAMDQHVARLEELTGLRLRAKIYWARGRLLGQGPHCVYGIVNGSAQSPACFVDEHELAHAVETQHDSPDGDHPTLLGEGRALSRSVGIKELAKRALADREWLAGMGKNWGNLSDSERTKILSHMVEPRGQERLLWKVWEQGPAVLYLRELTDPFWYHRHSGPVYSIGGAFVDFLVRRQGSKAFPRVVFRLPALGGSRRTASAFMASTWTRWRSSSGKRRSSWPLTQYDLNRRPGVAPDRRDPLAWATFQGDGWLPASCQAISAWRPELHEKERKELKLSVGHYGFVIAA